MITKSFGLVIISVLVIQGRLVPFDLIADAKEKLEDLRQIVLSAIYVAENDLDDFNLDLQVFGNNAERAAIVAIQTEAATINSTLTNLKDLALSAGVDITDCLQGREDSLKRLLTIALADLNDCVFGKITQGSRILTEIKYLIDTSINTVNALDFQLELCQPDSEECINLIVEQIELATEKVPQQIDVEILNAQQLFSELKVSLQECADVYISHYVSGANTILGEITQCVNAIIG